MAMRAAGPAGKSVEGTGAAGSVGVFGEAGEAGPWAIKIEDVSKTFPRARRPAVAGVNMQVAPGEFLVILGSSGSGKTTLLKMINRIHDMSSGRILVDGVDVRSVPVTELRRRIGYVIQEVGLFPHQTVAQNIATVPRILGWDRQRIDQRVDFLLDLMQLPPEQYRQRRPRQLSGGQQQRVGIARALAADPPILLMDEPFGALDAITRSALQEELLHIQQRFQKVVIFVTHDVDEAFRLADRVAVMHEGRIVQCDTPLRLLTHPADDFVARLIRADDVLQQLKLRPVADYMVAGAGGLPGGLRGTVSIPLHANLQEALAAVLRAGGRPVAVVDRDQRAVGWIGWEQLQGVARRPAGTGGAADAGPMPSEMEERTGSL